MKEPKQLLRINDYFQLALSESAYIKVIKLPIALILSLTATATLATDYVWKTNPSAIVVDGQQFAAFEFPSNWTSSLPLLAPISSPDTNLIFNRCARDGRDCIVTPLNLTANRQVGGLFFSGDSDQRVNGDFNLQGESLVVFSNITNNSFTEQTINNNIITGDDFLVIDNNASANGGNFVGAMTFNGVISGAGKVEFRTDIPFNSINLMGENTYSGGTTLAQFTRVELGASERLNDNGSVFMAFDSLLNMNGFDETIGSLSGAASSSIIGNNGTLTINQAPGITIFDGDISGTGDLVKKGDGNLVLRGNNGGLTGTIFIQDGLITIGSNPNVGRNVVGGDLNISAGAVFDMNGFSETVGNLSGAGIVGRINGRLTANQTADTTFSGELRGNGLFEKTGNGVLTLSGSNGNFTGKTHIINGTLALGGASALNSLAGDLEINAGALFDMRGRNEGVVNLFGSGAINLGSGTLSVNQTVTNSFSGVISGTGDFTKNGDGELRLLGNNTFTGATRVNQGTLTLGNADTLRGGVIVNGGNLNLGNTNETVSFMQLLSGTVSGSGALFSQSGVFDVRSGAVNAVLAGTSSLVKEGDGQVTLNNANTYSGDTFINAGKLVLNNRNALSQSAVNLSNAGTLELTLDSNVKSLQSTTGGLVNIFGARALVITDDANKVFNGNISGGGSLSLATGASQTLAGNNTYSGSTFINRDAVLTIAEGGSIVNGSGFIQLGNTIVNGLLKQQNIDIREGVLSGNGTVEANRMTVQAEAQIKPGNSTGTLVLITDLDLLGGLETEIKNTDFFDVLAVEGSVSLHDTTYFNFLFDEDFMPQGGNIFQFITATGGFDFGIDLNFDTWFSTSKFSVSGLLEGLNWRISHFDGSQLAEASYMSLVLYENVTNPVSAPAGLMLFGFCMILFCSYSCRKKERA